MILDGVARRAQRWVGNGTASCGVATIVLAGAGCEGSFDDSHIRSVPVTVDAPCDADGVELDYETEYVQANGDHHIEAVIVRGIADACAGSDVTVQLRSERRGVEFVYEGTSPVATDGPTIVQPWPTFELRDDRGISVGPAEVIHLDVTAIELTIT